MGGRRGSQKFLNDVVSDAPSSIPRNLHTYFSIDVHHFNCSGIDKMCTIAVTVS